MYEKFYGFSEKPFALRPDPRFLYFGRHHKRALLLMEYGLANEASFLLITGEIGAGKTTLIRCLLGPPRQGPGRSASSATPAASPAGCCSGCASPSGST